MTTSSGPPKRQIEAATADQRSDLYSDYDGGQRAIARFGINRAGEDADFPEARADVLPHPAAVTTAVLTDLLIYARKHIPWVQANLILTDHDDRDQIRTWQDKLKKHGVWVSEPVPMFPYPGTPMYQQMFGPPDDHAWERAHHYYTSTFNEKGYSDIQESRPANIEDLECTF